MTTLSVKHFDALSYVKKAKELGTSEELAEFQARQIEEAIEVAITAIKEEISLKDLATKRDLESAKNQIILWVGGLVMASGLIQHFFK